eukprot:TRINITY_DN2695_c0_g1_i6.p2 TRINITY_DN2695_c0_g1~~TRINITY_DN2695_c0_g1_i6.p2  ORF type:complete len:106 (-),score=21.96 TRINITY_DN2695_c0_g1_i6:557-874(-)
MCNEGNYCSDNNVSAVCPQGFFCPTGTGQPQDCDVFYDCPEGSATPSISITTLIVTLGYLGLLSGFWGVWGLTDERRTPGTVLDADEEELKPSTDKIKHQQSLLS